MALELIINTEKPLSATEAAAAHAFLEVLSSRGVLPEELFKPSQELKEAIKEFIKAPDAPRIDPQDNPEAGVEIELLTAGFNAPGNGAVQPAAVPAAGIAPSLPPAPAAPASASAQNTSAALRDTSGLPWDSRIHASAKTVNADGTWRYKRGVDALEIANVVQELRGVLSIPAPPPPPQPAPAAGAGAPMTFMQFMPKVTAACKAGTLDKGRVDTVLAQYGLPHMPALATRTDLIPTVHDALFGAAT